jgi:two-component system aerobic respiration control sensor histidine kinase ArcB
MEEIQKLKVLIVEDNPIAQRIGKLVLQMLNCDLDIAESGATAIKYFSENRYNLVFMDIGLPDMDGYEIAGKLREIEVESQLNPIPIICLSIHTDHTFQQQAFQVGMNHYLVKPLTVDNCKIVLKQFANSAKTLKRMA